MAAATLPTAFDPSTRPTFSPFPILTVHGCSLLGRRGSWLIIGPNGNLLACKLLYSEACDELSRLGSMHLRWLHSAKYYAIRARNWSQRAAVRRGGDA
jgi:hypothetical protein